MQERKHAGLFDSVAQIAALVTDDILKRPGSRVVGNLFHIRKAMEWLCRAQDATPDAGIPIRYALKKMSSWHPAGWNPSYPETTGYIIPTFVNCSRLFDDERYLESALRMADWLLTVQKEDGSFKGGDISSRMGSIVFDTGQIIFGFLSAFRQSNQERYLRAARKAGDWLRSIQNEDGTWKQFSFGSIPHSYHSRVAWALLELYQVDGDKKYLDGGRRSASWAAATQQGNGWFSQAGFSQSGHKDPLTHTIAYTIRGILESGVLLNDKSLIAAARKSVDVLSSIIRPDGSYSGNYDRNWRGCYRYSCLTGNAQISIILSRLHQLTGEKSYCDKAAQINGFLKAIQRTAARSKDIEGAIPGSSPIWGRYEGYAYPNWATKFFIDALIREEIADPNSRYYGKYEFVKESG